MSYKAFCYQVSLESSHDDDPVSTIGATFMEGT